ncbi:hypothetical protein QBC39DRAFT_339873, partial [Podospora conica]
MDPFLHALRMSRMSVGLTLDIAVAKRAMAAGAALTSTVLQTTYTVTRTTAVIVPGTTAVELAYAIVTKTFVPPAQTVCDEPDIATVTRFEQEPQQTLRDVVYVTVFAKETVRIEQTQYSTHSDARTASACLANGGQYGV